MMFELLSRILITYTVMYIFHELGHYWVLKAYKVKKIVWKWNKIDYYSNLSRDQKQNVLFGGIFLGLLPIALLGKRVDYSIYFLLIWAYLWGCRRDLKRLDWKRLRQYFKE